MENIQVTFWRSFGKKIGYLFFGSLFFISGVLKIMQFGGVATKLEAIGLPLPFILTSIVIFIEISCGTALALRWHVRWAAIILILFTIPATFMFHAFWSVDNVAFTNQLNHFLKNISIVGALLMVICTNTKDH